MDSPKARAVNPPSAASSITKMISFMPYRSKAPLDSARFSVNSQERSGEQSARRRGHSESLRESLTFEFPLQRFNVSTSHVTTARHMSERVCYPDTDEVSSTSKVVAFIIAGFRFN